MSLFRFIDDARVRWEKGPIGSRFPRTAGDVDRHGPQSFRSATLALLTDPHGSTYVAALADTTVEHCALTYGKPPRTASSKRSVPYAACSPDVRSPATSPTRSRSASIATSAGSPP